MPGERTSIRYQTITLVSADGTKEYTIQVKDNNTVPSASEIAAVRLNHVWLKSDAVAGGKMGWVKTDTTTVKTWGAIDA